MSATSALDTLEIGPIDFCMVDFSHLYTMRRSQRKTQILRAIIVAAVEQNSLRTWFESTIVLKSEGPLAVVGISHRHATAARQCLFLQLELGDAATRALSLLDGIHWTNSLISIEAGPIIIDDDANEVLCWNLDAVNELYRYTFVEYVPHTETLDNYIRQAHGDAQIAFSFVLDTLEYAWNAGVVHEEPYTRHVIVNDGVAAAAWTCLAKLRCRTSSDALTEYLLVIVWDFYRVVGRAEFIDNLVERELRLPLELCEILRESKIRPDGRVLRLWNRTLSFDDFLSAHRVWNVSPRVDECVSVAHRAEPLDLDGYIYHALSLHERNEIDDKTWQRYDTAIDNLFRKTKSVVESLFESAALESRPCDPGELWAMHFSTLAMWATIRILVDMLSQKNAQRSLVVDDMTSSTIDSYVSEIRSRVVRVSGEWESVFLKCRSTLVYDKIATLQMLWDAIRDTTHEIH